VIGLLAIFSAAVLLMSAWVGMRAEISARRHLPLQFTDDLSSRYYMIYALFDRSIPSEIRQRIAVSTVLAIVAIAGFAAVAYLAGHSVIAVLLLLICAYAVANTVVQRRRSLA
jgi:predicted neutral ceramidase superfamily lipid hydrolase